MTESLDVDKYWEEDSSLDDVAEEDILCENYKNRIAELWSDIEKLTSHSFLSYFLPTISFSNDMRAMELCSAGSNISRLNCDVEQEIKFLEKKLELKIKHGSELTSTEREELCSAYIKSGDITKARKNIAELCKSSEETQRLSDANNLMWKFGVELEQHQQPDFAIQCYKKVLLYNLSDRKDVLLRIAELYAQMEKYKRALFYYENLIKENEDNFSYYTNAIICCLLLDNPEKAQLLSENFKNIPYSSDQKIKSLQNIIKSCSTKDLTAFTHNISHIDSSETLTQRQITLLLRLKRKISDA